MLSAHGIGRLVKDPELKVIKNNDKDVSVVKFTLVFNEFIKTDKVNSVFLDFEAWDSAAETIVKLCKKGDRLHIRDAVVRQNSWDDKETGKKKSRLYFRVNGFDMLLEKRNQENDSQ